MKNYFKYEIGVFMNWLRWCWIFKEIVSYNVGYVSMGNLTLEEYNYPNERLMETI